MHTILLNNQTEIPVQGIGTRKLADFDICEQVVLFSIESGIRLIDSSPSYHNEEAIGLAISETPVDRSDLFITSKSVLRFIKKVALHVL